MNERRDPDDLPGLAEVYRRTPGPEPAARARLMSRLERESAPRRAWIRISAPGELTLRPLAAAAFAGLLIVIGYALSLVPPGARHARTTVAQGLTGAPAEQGDSSEGAGSGASERLVEFVLVDMNAARVSVVGDFNDWDPARTPMRRVDAAGTWTARVPLPEGRRVYAFVVDGDRWVVDPTAPLAPADEFGAARSVVVVSGSGI